ncbi:MAG: hypothetical protein HY228_02780 [Candidatus Yonathbacteria bacterium]|nr:hypothetical protein [Candidatus Yonathbacteria bacterium]
MKMRKLLQRIGIAIGIIIILGYGVFALQGIIRGPKIILGTPQSGFATTTPLILVSGRAVRVTNLSLNGATTTLDLAGNFSESLLLSRGYNIMTIEGFDKYGRSAKETVEMTLLTTSTVDQF